MKKIILASTFLFSVAAFAQKVDNRVVEAGCGMCQFKVKTEKGCAMAVKIDGKVYNVEGMDKKIYGDAHAADGYCKVMKKAIVSGEVKRGKFQASAFRFAK